MHEASLAFGLIAITNKPLELDMWNLSMMVDHKYKYSCPFG
jgi:hypothetical protein